MDKLNAAKVFVTVVETGSFTASAEILKLSRSMVTRYVETTEAWLGARLLHRSTRRLTLTSMGEECLPLIENLLLQADALSAVTSDKQILKGSIRIATSVSLGFTLLSGSLSSFLEKYPDVNIEITNTDERIDLIEYQVDLAVRITSSLDSSLIGKPIAKCSSVLVASKEYLNKRAKILIPEDLLQHDCLQYSNFKNKWEFQRNMEKTFVSVKSKISANEATFLLHACLNNLGIAQLPKYLAKKHIENGNLIPLLDDWELKDMSIYVFYSSRKNLPKIVRAMIVHLEEYFKKNIDSIN